MTTPIRTPPSLRKLMWDVLFLIRMRASEWRFQYHFRQRERHQAATARHLQGMCDEVEFRTELCERRAGIRS